MDLLRGEAEPSGDDGPHPADDGAGADLGAPREQGGAAVVLHSQGCRRVARGGEPPAHGQPDPDLRLGAGRRCWRPLPARHHRLGLLEDGEGRVRLDGLSGGSEPSRSHQVPPPQLYRRQAEFGRDVLEMHLVGEAHLRARRRPERAGGLKVGPDGVHPGRHGPDLIGTTGLQSAHGRDEGGVHGVGPGVVVPHRPAGEEVSRLADRGRQRYDGRLAWVRRLKLVAAGGRDPDGPAGRPG